MWLCEQIGIGEMPSDTWLIVQNLLPSTDEEMVGALKQGTAHMIVYYYHIDFDCLLAT